MVNNTYFNDILYYITFCIIYLIGRWGTHRVLEYLLDEGIPVEKSEGIKKYNGLILVILLLPRDLT